MLLCDSKEGENVIIVSVDTSEITRKRLELLGVKVGETGFISACCGGSVLFSINGKMLALGKLVAEKVVVDACSFDR